MDEQQYEELKWSEAPLYYHKTCPSVSATSETNPGLPIDDDEKENHRNAKTNKRRHRIALRAETTALLIVDVQPEYWGNCPSVRQDFPDFPERLKSVVETCRNRRAKIIWVRADYRRAHSPWLVQFERLRGKTPGFMVEVPCDPGSENFTWEDFATPLGGEVIIPKMSWSSTSDTALKEVLRVSGIDTVLVCGLITSVCVQHSAFGVFEAGYRTLLVTDACADRGRARHNAALALYGDYMYELVTSQDLQDPATGLIPAKPLWLTRNNLCKNVSPLNSFVDLQSALAVAQEQEEKNCGGQVSPVTPTTDENEASTVPSSLTTLSSSEFSPSVNNVQLIQKVLDREMHEAK
mmetsp:Transcript_26206/g.44686  ORF Transcript_26206/g.44686 Transcript_26206/m.44686 type:complete len:350 (-) Transcript_26206:191-1240(-)|eukprot:CAMPEP_0183741582 /NCGR_PEP_ID=MMETSP0737-20130205/62513_1 /TAXON_ID=385413 /ORGANISM="Thalassiosira miniscula, Strain CCMP1093" /LENGTH=349 /DNA_ID=CAMNT_0025976959 /DNA_START=364 /DNA_END=1413 /DNA_ORIENTATION=+